MNIMRKLRNGTSSSNANAASTATATSQNAGEPNDNAQQNQLGLMHLKKLFTEYTNPKEPLSEAERDYKLYNMLPLFCKIFGTTHSTDMSEKFWDISAFCQQVSRLIVSEIRKRASNQSTEAASIAIVKFLEIENCEESSNGWMLLTSLNLLAAGDLSLIQVMTSASVPSTLVKCLYLFFDLPDIPEHEANKNDGGDYTPRERRVLLQKVFVQVLIRLCSHPCPCEELARMDDLTLLFSVITSQCTPQNLIWRKSASEVLTTLSRHGLSEPVVNYIHSKRCVALCIDNMQRAQQLQPLEIVEMFVAVFCFLKDSSEVSQVLLDDFRTCQGYVFLSEFLLKLEAERSRNSDAMAALRNLVLMIASLSMCGFIELHPAPSQNNSLFQMKGFQMPQASSHGTSVRNVHAFQVLQKIFLKSNSSTLCCTILDAISSVYHSDNANYFILEPQNTLSQFIEKIYTKHPKVQGRLMELLEFVVCQLNYVPCKELISISILLKSYQSISCSIVCMKTLINILRHNAIFKEVYREVGILEVFVQCLIKYSAFLLERAVPGSGNHDIQIDNEDELANDENEILGKLILEAITLLLNGMNVNAAVFRESGGAKCIHDMVKFRHGRSDVLDIVRELVISQGGDDDMLFVLSTMHASPAECIELKIHILRALLGCLRESHRTRTIFRKVGGFVYVTSVLVSLDGLLDGNIRDDPAICITELLQLLNVVCHTLTTAMRFEPANAKFFQQEICSSSLCDTLRLLGCFGMKTVLEEQNIELRPSDELQQYFHSIFSGSTTQPKIDTTYPLALTYATLIYRLLYDIALDNFEKPNMAGIGSINVGSNSTNNNNKPNANTATASDGKPDPRSLVSSLNLTQPAPEPLVVHPGVVICMLQLLPSIQSDDGAHANEALSLQIYLSEVIRSLVRTERNQQIMCEAGLAGQLLQVGRQALSEETNALHVSLQYILERLAAQALQATELREFLRLGMPLCCESPNLQQPYKSGGPVPLTRIKTLVSMTTPRDFRAHASCTLPPFVEMDMSAEGFGCLYLPSVAPQAPNIGGSLDGSVIGGIGSGDRVFPPQTGLTYSTWFCVDKFSDPRTDPHCVRLLTIVRTVSQGQRDENLVCMNILLSARDKAIIVSTQETLVPHNVGEWEPEYVGDNCARVWCPDLLHEGQWHHLVVVLNRAVLKNSSFSLYLDGKHMHSHKLHYISQNPGATSTNVTVASSVYSIIGTPPPWRRHSRLCWKQGVCHLIEDIITAATVQIIFALGPHYVGSLQAPHLGKQNEPINPLVPEERVMFGLNAKAMSHLTLAKIRKIYSRSDNRSIAKQLGMSSHENATPIRILHNSAGHLAGAARTLGGVVVGYLGVRVFSPYPVSVIIDTVGGCNVLLGIIAMAQDVESLYAGVKALTCVVRSNRAAQNEMDRKRSYQTLAMFFKKKRNLLNSHILHLTFTLVGTVNSGQETSAIPNVTAFQDLLCDLEIWHGAPNDLLRSLLEHLLQLTSDSGEKRLNCKILRDLQCVLRLLHIIPDIHDPATKEITFSLLSQLISGQPRSSDLLLFGQFIVSKLPLSSSNRERSIVLPSSVDAKPETTHTNDNDPIRNIVLRNRCLEILHKLLFTNRNTINYILADDISRVLGFDWVLLLMQSQVHPSTVIWGMRILVVICAHEPAIARFREGTQNGGYLKFTDAVSQSGGTGTSLMLGTPQLSPSPASAAASVVQVQPGIQLPTQIANEVKTAVLRIPGFQYLEWLLPHHLEIPEIYYLIVAMMMGQPVKVMASDHTKLDLDRVWAFLWGKPIAQSSAPKVNLCPEAVCCLLIMVRHIVHSNDCTVEWLEDHPVTIIQVLFSMYHNLPDFMSVLMLGDTISALASVLFPIIRKDGNISENSSPSTPENSSSAIIFTPPILTQLTDQPVRKFVTDFLRVIVVDSLSLSLTGNKTTPVIDLVLEASPENSDLQNQAAYQTEIISALMDHLLAADVLVGEQAALPIVPLLQSHVQNIAPNVFYLTARIVDKIWQGTLNKDPHEVFDFVIKLIGQAKRRSSSSLSLEQLHHSLNRIILYLLSRPIDSVTDQMPVLEALHKLTTHRLLIFGAGNHELDFIGCLTYCLLQLIADARIPLESNATNRSTTWHVNPSGETTAIEARDSYLNQHQGRNLITAAAHRVWEELYVCKKPAIEEVFKITLSPPANNTKAPSLNITRDQVLDAAHKLWCNYIEMERKSTCRVPWEIHNQIQSKIQKVTGGLTRLASRTKVKKEEYVRTRSQIAENKAIEWTAINVGLVKDLWEQRLIQRTNMLQHTLRYVCQDWIMNERELIRERGLWGPVQKNPLDKWLLDSTEGPHRMRKKTMRNDAFYHHYPYRPEFDDPDNRQLKYKVAISFDSKLYFTYCQLPPRVLCEPENNSDPNKTHDKAITGSPTNSPTEQAPSLARAQSEPGNEEMDENEDEVGLISDNQTLLRMLEENEKISNMFRCARIQGLDTFEGLLLFGKEYCYVVDGFTLIKNREIRDIDSLPSGAYEPILPSPGSPQQRSQQTLRQYSKFSYEDIREVHKRRYLLQPIALEVFSGDGRNYLLSFPRKVRNKVYQRFMAMATAIADNAAQSVAGQKRGASVEQTSGLFSSLIGETSVTQRWVRGEISNFQYLMHLNTLAGRSYNDLMQYPVFPWILADYDSEELDFTNPKTFRNFAKPMGAQSPDRLEQFQKRFREWDDPHGETPPYHYGTHYSSAMIVCSYLVRMEPFTQHFLRLQGGHFDLADRMFHSMREAWQSASKFNMADVKELIPEFFYLPEFMSNANNFDLGTKQNGEVLGDVILPPWAKQDTREFIRVHRQALECDYVSQHLHLWIDLIFGCKQQGPGAVEAVNVFHHLFYEGNVDIYNIEDPLKKNATIGFINNFGQIPKQLFKKPHPCKKMHSSRTNIMDSNSLLSSNVVQPDKFFFHHLDNLKPSLQPIKELKGPVGQIIQPDKAVLSVEQNKVLMAPTFSRYIAWGFADHSLRIGMYDSDRALFVCEAATQNSGEILACACPNARTIVTAGTSSVVTIWEFDARHKSLSVKHSLHGHTDAVTCLAASPAYNVIVSGSRDGSAIVWDLSRFIFVRQLRDHVGLVAAVSINDLTGDIATCSATYLHIWSANGDALATVNTSVGSADRMQQILCVAFSTTHEWDQQNVVITGSTDGVVRMWSMEYVQVPVETKKSPKINDTKETKNHEVPMITKGSSDSPDQQIKLDLVRQMSITKEPVITKSGSESSISETCDSSKTEPTVDKGAPESTDDTRSIAVTKEALDIPITNMGKRGSLTSAKSLHELKHEVANESSKKDDPDDAPKTESKGIRPSKSDTSLTESFVIIDNENKRKHCPNALREGFKWQRQLVFRSKLTMHTAYDRKDNAEPASITALAVSKDHKTLYVGDARGRVFSWSVTEQPNRGMADHWLKDEGADQCVGCQVRFTLYERKHHCRNCGQVFCNKCSRFESEISRLRILKPVRVCQTCYTTLRNNATSSPDT